ncbi:MAG: class I SAM-dependent methyltransferase [Cyclobacteriaceae bacterium]
MITINECPICKTSGLQEFLRCRDYTVSHETFDINRCPVCTLAITTPRPENSKLGEYYQSEEYISHSGRSSGGIGILYRIARNFSLTWKRVKIQRYKQTGTILDVGCGTGEFLSTMKNSGWKVEGMEVSDVARKKAENLIGQTISQELNNISNNQFEVITAWHVIEHIPDLLPTIQKLKQLLNKDGILFIAVPNYESYDAQQYKEKWAGYDVPRHLWHFSKKSMESMLQHTGLKLLDILPMKLDSYYVSMLSEKYSNQKASAIVTLFKGFFTGTTSNIKAGKTNYSSLIYVTKINEN